MSNEPSNCVEYINDDGRRFAWSESNVQYEEISPDYGAFTMLRKRLDKCRLALEKIEKLSAGGPHIDAKDGFTKALAGLQEARALAKEGLK